MSLVQHVLTLAARALVSAIFLWGGATQIALFWDQSLTQLEGKGVPYPVVMLTLAVAGQLIGGLSLLLGFRARWGAVISILFLVGVTAVMHNFWSYESDSAEYLTQSIAFLKNLGLLGGLLMILAFGPGGFAADTFLRKQPSV